MTINSEQVLPGNENPADPAAANQAQQAIEPQVVDIDAQDLADAQAAVEAEKAAAGGEAGSQAQPGAPGQQPASQSQGQPQPAPQGADAVMIPKARLDEVAGQRDQERQNAAYWRGVAEARAQQPAPPQGGTQPQLEQQQPTVETRLAAIHTKQDELAAKFDNGEITYSDLVKQQRELSAEEQGIREQQLLAKAQPASQPAPQSDALYLNTLTAELENEHPWVRVFDQVGTEIDWKYLQDRAIENCVARGIDVTKGDNGRYNLRREVAILADALGPNLIADRARARGIAIPGQPDAQQQQQQQPPGLSATAQARANKLNLAEGAPPNLQRMSGATGDGTPTDSRIDQMSDDEIGNLPDATRRKLLGIM